MNHTYYYFAAGLPTLSFEGKSPMTPQKFLEDCHEFISKEDYESIKILMEGNWRDPQKLSGTFRRIWQANHNFVNALTAFRAQRAGKNPRDYIQDGGSNDPRLDELFHAASKEENLLEGQKIIDSARWEMLDAMSLGHYFDEVILAAYALKLKILERYEAVQSPRGRELFEQIKAIEIK